MQCASQAARRWQLKNPQRTKETRDAWVTRNRPALRAIQRRYYKANKKTADAAVKRSRDAQAPAEKRAMYRRKVGLPEPTRACPVHCEICGRLPLAGRGLSLDHDHATGEFRGWLCGECNMGIGKLGDNISGLAAAAAYLRRAEKDPGRSHNRPGHTARAPCI